MNSDEQNILKGKTIIRTDPENGQDELTERLRNAGALVLSMPLIAIRPMPFRLKRDYTQYDWLIFTSKNAITPFIRQYPMAPNQKIAVLGPGTAKQLVRLGYRVDFTGKGKTAARFAGELSPIVSPHERILLVLGMLAPDTLEKSLSKKYEVERTNVYQTVMPEQVDPDLLNRIENDKYDVLLISSPSAINNLFAILRNKENLRIISIGQTTTAAIRKRNIEPVATAADPGYQGLAETTISYFRNCKNQIQ